MKKQFIIILVISFFNIYGQKINLSDDENVNKHISALVNQKVDTICYYEDQSSITNSYVIWKKNGVTKCCRFKEYKKATEEIIEANKFWQYYFNNKNIIRAEKLMPFEYKSIQKGKSVVEDVINESDGYLDIYNNGVAETHLWLSEYYLLKSDRIDNKARTNINYEHNKNLKRTVLVDILKNSIKARFVH